MVEADVGTFNVTNFIEKVLAGGVVNFGGFGVFALGDVVGVRQVSAPPQDNARANKGANGNNG